MWGRVSIVSWISTLIAIEAKRRNIAKKIDGTKNPQFLLLDAIFILLQRAGGGQDKLLSRSKDSRI